MTELKKLEEYLKSSGAKYEVIDEAKRVVFGEDISRHQIIVYDNNGKRVWDAVCQYGSYGYLEGLLEVMWEKEFRHQDSIEGWMTADAIIARLEGRDEE